MASVCYRCPKCDSTVAGDLVVESSVVCPRCGYPAVARVDDLSHKLSSCLICGGQELFIRKDFPQRLGVTIVILGFAASCVAWYFQWIITTFGILFGTAFVDVALYAVMGNVLECYRCHAQYRRIPRLDEHDAFNLETYERHRQLAARLEQQANKSTIAQPNEPAES